jgi:LmbE family N-acetylglucosaminyl deacetylase
MANGQYFDIRKRLLSNDISTVFPNWDRASESVIVLSPHDDDALLGVGYMLCELVRQKVPLTVVIFCKGDTGYSGAALRDGIVETRKAETLNAYRLLGLTDTDIVFMDKPDFALRRHVAWNGLVQEGGLFGEMIRLLRARRATRLFVANGYREHSDHTAVYDVGMFDGVQAGDPILADFGTTTRLRSTHVYSVWADFSPEDALVSSRKSDLRANMGMVAGAAVEERISSAVRCYVSQGAIIDGLVRMRAEKRSDKGYIELYQWVDPRPRLPYAPYVTWLNAL